MISMLRQSKLFLSRLKVALHHSGSSGTTSPFRLLSQGLPYYTNRQGYARDPLTLFLSVNGRCDLRCRMCDIGNKNTDSQFYKNLAGDEGKDFPYERFKTLVDEVSSFKPYISITTTEPLLYKPMFEAVAYVKSKGMEMNITTGGLRISKRVDEILDSGLHKLSVSIDGPPAIHDEMRGLPGSYDRIMDGVRLLIEKKKTRGLKRPYIYFTAFVADTNYAHLVELVEGLPLEDLERVNIKLMVFLTESVAQKHNDIYGEKYPATAACVPDNFAADSMDLAVLREQAREIRERFGDKVTLHFESEGNEMDTYFNHPEEFMDSTRCVFPWFISQITNDGDLITNTRCFNVKFGNIMDRSFADVWNGPDFRQFRRDLQKHGRFPGCSRCDGVPYR